MKDAYVILHQKEAELDRVRKQVESLNITAALLAEDDAESESGEEINEDVNEDEPPSKKPSSSVAPRHGNDAREPEWNPESSPFLNALKRAM